MLSSASLQGHAACSSTREDEQVGNHLSSEPGASLTDPVLAGVLRGAEETAMTFTAPREALAWLCPRCCLCMVFILAYYFLILLCIAS